MKTSKKLKNKKFFPHFFWKKIFVQMFSFQMLLKIVLDVKKGHSKILVKALDFNFPCLKKINFVFFPQTVCLFQIFEIFAYFEFWAKFTNMLWFPPKKHFFPYFSLELKTSQRLFSNASSKAKKHAELSILGTFEVEKFKNQKKLEKNSTFFEFFNFKCY